MIQNALPQCLMGWHELFRRQVIEPFAIGLQQLLGLGAVHGQRHLPFTISLVGRDAD